MAQKTKIPWAQMSWNPVTGCDPISPGCAHCYARSFAERWRGVKGHAFEHGFDLQLRPERLDQPSHWRKPRLVFVNSMSDLFHRDIPREYIDRVFAAMANAPNHTFQVLTKRSDRMREYIASRYHHVPSNIWLGVTVEDRPRLTRIADLQAIPATRFLSCEPLLEDLGQLDLTGIHQVIVGGESGPKFRPMEVDWVRNIRDQCVSAGVPFFFKQWAGFRPAELGKKLDGREWHEYPQTNMQQTNLL